MANSLCERLGLEVNFAPKIVDSFTAVDEHYAVIFLPPSTNPEFYSKPQAALSSWLDQHHQQGAILTSACAGAFLLAQTHAAQQKSLTTHWGLVESFKHNYPQLTLEPDAILIDHSDVISAGGMMSWLDLALALVSRFSDERVARDLGKTLVIDTAPRRQTYYQQFTPSYLHGDKRIIEVQQYISNQIRHPLPIGDLAAKVNLTIRTFQRRFVKATGITPVQYIQKVRVQHMCDRLEASNDSFEFIALNAGYEDASACRKVFVKLMGLTPSEFRRRFKRR